MNSASLIGRDIVSHALVSLPILSRFQALYCIGKQGMGKSNFIQTSILQDMHKGYGICVIDPHSDLFVNSLAMVPPYRAEEVIILDMKDTNNPFPFNILSGINLNDRDVIQVD